MHRMCSQHWYEYFTTETQRHGGMRNLLGVGFGRAPRPNAAGVALSAASPRRPRTSRGCGLSAAIAHADPADVLKASLDSSTTA